MKQLYLLSLPLFFCFASHAQQINPQDIYDTSDYSFLKELLPNRRVVMLGEQTHGDGATFDEKVKLVKYLHEKLGYNTIVFESGLYDNYKASLFAKDTNEGNPYYKSVIDIWSGSKAFEDLLSYVEVWAAQGDTIKIMGFDSQEGALFENHFMEDLQELLYKRKLSVDSASLQNIEKAFVARDLEGYATQKSDSIRLYSDFNDLLNQLNSINSKNLHEKVMHQVVISKIADVSYEIRLLQEQKIAVQNPRDKQMANNMAFLIETFPGEKFICWGASYHFAQNINTVSATEVTSDFIKRQTELENQILGHTESGSSEIAALKEAVTMTDLLRQNYRDQIFSIAFSSFEGDYLGQHDKSFPILTPPNGSIEYELRHLPSAYVDWRNMKESYYCSALGNIPLKAEWVSLYDGLIFIRKSYVPKLRAYNPHEQIATQPLSSGVRNGTVYDGETGESIPYADVVIAGTNQSVLTNTEGEFAIAIPAGDKTGKLIISSFGYVTDTVAADVENIKIALRPDLSQQIELNEVTVTRQRQLTAEEIVKAARKNVVDNYYQEPYNQSAFIRVRNQRNGVIVFNEEASIESYNAKGISGSNNPSGNFYAQIKELRNTTGNYSADKWSGIGSFWTIFDRDVILSKANVLYRTSSYVLKKEDPTTYNGRDVYKISFVNASPGIYSTGFGYPSPISSKGTLYIDMESFAVLKYEHCVTREARINKRRPDVCYENSHNIITTYKQIDGKYFPNYCKEVTQEKVFSVKDKKQVSQNYYTTELMSANIETENLNPLVRPVDKLKEGYKVSQDNAFAETSFLPENDMQFTECDVNGN